MFPPSSSIKIFRRVTRKLWSPRRNFASEATFQTQPYKLHKLEEGPGSSVTISKDQALTMYSQMQTIRRMENAAGNLYKAKEIRGFCHLYTGQEACAVGMRMAMKEQDTAITAYRAHGWTYLMGVSVFGIIAELMGKRNGCTKGKGGSMHMYAKNYYGGNGIVGAQLPLGTGIALAHKYKGDGGVTITCYGDGAANQGQVFESYNMAKLWSLPVIFVCENNGFGMGTSAARASANTNYYQRGEYVPGIWVDGMDVLSVLEATRFARVMCAEGRGPVVMETATYRYQGHSMSDPGTSYRTREEIQEVRTKRDPITCFKAKIIEAGLVTDDEIQKVDADVKAEVDKAVQDSQADKEPGLEDLAADVYAENLEGRLKGVTCLDSLEHRTVGGRVNLK